MVRGQLGADFDQRVFGDAEFDQLALGRNLGLGEVTSHRLRRPLGLGFTGTELERDITIPVGGLVRHDLDIIHVQHRAGHVRAVFGEDTRHAQLAGDHACSAIFLAHSLTLPA